MITELCRGGLPCIAKKSNRPQNRRGCGPRRELAACLTRGRNPVPGRHPQSRDVDPGPAGGVTRPERWNRQRPSAQQFILQSAREPLRLNTPILGYFTAKSLCRLIDLTLNQRSKVRVLVRPPMISIPGRTWNGLIVF
jgi:hypothetical protein